VANPVKKRRERELRWKVAPAPARAGDDRPADAEHIFQPSILLNQPNVLLPLNSIGEYRLCDGGAEVFTRPEMPDLGFYWGRVPPCYEPLLTSEHRFDLREGGD